MARVEIKPHGGTTEVFIDGMEQKDVTGYSVRQHVGIELPLVVLEYGHENEYLVGDADVEYKFHPETLQVAAKVMRNELLKHGDWYNALVSSIAGYLKEVPDGTGFYDIAEGLAKRLIGDN